MRHLSFPYLFSMFVLLSVATDCTHKDSKPDDLKSISPSPDTNSKCSSCLIDSFDVKQASQIQRQKVIINEPVAVQFFNQVRLGDKYQIENYDSLIKLFKGDGEKIYDLKNQYFYFVKAIKPILIENSIKIIDSVSNDYLLEFRVSDASVFVNPKDYNDQDGVLLFIPGKKPVFWTADREEISCKNSQGFVEQYFLCSAYPKQRK